MKCFFLKLLLIFFMFYFNQFISCSKIKSRSKIKMRNQKGQLSSKKSKANFHKNGPLTWETFTHDPILDSLLKDEREIIKSNVNAIIEPPKINAQLPPFLGGNAPLSDNQKSKTFRTVSPFEDSTIDYKGKKYSKMYMIKSIAKVNPGYYGKSRLTR
jgi:hypothetical protein